jgi:prepilin-type N-terminal cleavage/methylation domain-containing protein
MHRKQDRENRMVINRKNLFMALEWERGFTLIEVAIVLVIIGLLVGMGTGLRLNAGEAVYRYATNNRSCGGGIQDQMDYNTAVYADSDNDGRVNFSGTDR